MEGAERLVAMANQIGKFFVAQRSFDAAAGIADHLRKFWDPLMRAGIIAHLDRGGAGLDPPVRDAVAHLSGAGQATSSPPGGLAGG